MIHAQTRKHGLRYFVRCVATTAVIFLLASAGFAQTQPAAPHSPVNSAAVKSPTAQAPAAKSQAAPAPAPQSTTVPWTEDMNKYPGLLTELGQLIEKLQHNLQFPAARNESRLLPLMPETTMSYTAFSNYGEVIRQALKIFRQELQESAVLRDWWEHGQIAASGPKLEESLEKLAQLHEYLGEEIAVAGAMDGEKLKLLLVAEIRKPGFKQMLQQWINQAADKSKPGVRVLDLKELATAEDKSATEELLVLVRPDFVVAATDVATLRNFNARLAQGGGGFVATPFGERIQQEYRGGVTILSATDVHKILSQVPQGTKEAQRSLQRSGFAD